MGAHIAGAAGKFVTSRTRKLLPRITGLEPDVRCRSVDDMLAPDDAEFVDVIDHYYGSYILFFRKTSTLVFFYKLTVIISILLIIKLARELLQRRNAKSNIGMGNVNFYPKYEPCCNLYPELWALYAGTVYLEYEESLQFVENRHDKGLEKITAGYAASRDSTGNYYFKIGCNNPIGQSHHPDDSNQFINDLQTYHCTVELE